MNKIIRGSDESNDLRSRGYLLCEEHKVMNGVKSLSFPI